MSRKSIIAALVFVVMSGAAYGQQFTSGIYFQQGSWFDSDTDIHITENTFTAINEVWGDVGYTRIDRYSEYLSYTDEIDDVGVYISQLPEGIGSSKVKGYTYTHTISVTHLESYFTRIYFANLK